MGGWGPNAMMAVSFVVVALETVLVQLAPLEAAYLEAAHLEVALLETSLIPCEIDPFYFKTSDGYRQERSKFSGVRNEDEDGS